MLSCDIKVSSGSTPSLRTRIASPQSPLVLLASLLAHNFVKDGVVIEAREPSGEIQLIIQGNEFSVMLVRMEKRADTSDTDNRRCVGPERVVDNHGVVDAVEVFIDVTREMRGASIVGVVETVTFSQESTEYKDGGIGCRDLPTPSPAIKRNVPLIIWDSARILRNNKDEAIGR